MVGNLYLLIGFISKNYSYLLWVFLCLVFTFHIGLSYGRSLEISDNVDRLDRFLKESQSKQEL